MQKIVVILFSLTFFLSGVGDVSAATINKPTNYLGMFGYWTFDGLTVTDPDNVLDSSGQGNHGDLTNTGITSRLALGKVGQALTFNGTSDGVVIGDNSTQRGMSTITFTAWVNPTSNVSEGNMIFKDSGSDHCYEYSINSGVFNVAIGTQWQFNAGPAVPLNTWSFLSAVWDGSNLSMAINGGAPTVVDLTDGPIGNTCNNSHLYLGSGNAGNLSFPGRLDEVRLFNRALTTNEIAAIYNSGGVKANNSNVAVSNGLNGYWTFDGIDMTPNVRDKSGSGNHAVLTGQSATTTSIGVKGQALLFDGVDDQVSLPDGLIYDQSTITLSLWFKTTDDGVLFGYWTDDIVSYVPIMYIGSNGKLHAQFFQGDVDPMVSATALNDGTWHHALLTIGGGSQSLYVDDELVDTLAGSHDGLTMINNSIGYGNINAVWPQNPGSGFVSFNGSIDDVRVYFRSLTASERLQIYNSGASKTSASQNNKFTNGLVGLWSFDGVDTTDKVYDRSGQGNHGGFFGGATSTLKTIGKIGQAFIFDATDNYVNIPHSSSLAITGNITISAWYRFADTGTWQALVSKNDADGGHSAPYFLYMLGVNNDNRARFFLADTAGSGFSDHLSNTTMTAGNWYHLVGVYNGTDMRLYINGVLDGGPTSRTGALQSKTSSLRIGARGDLGGEWGNGSIDDVRVYDRALSADEVLQLYNSGR